MTTLAFLETVQGLLSLLFLVILPGWTVYNIVGSYHANFRTRLAIQIALGLSLMSFVGLGLSWAGQINSNALYMVYGTVAIAAPILWIYRHPVKRLSTLQNLLIRILSRKMAVAVFPYLLGILIWHAYPGVHSADPGLHAFWSGWIVSTGHLPDYAAAGPSAQPGIFVFGPHLLLAAVSLVSHVPTTTSFWTPLLLLYLSILLAIQSITLQITGSETAATLASMFYATSQIPAARMLLGNLSDLTGYFLLATLILGLVSSSTPRSISIIAIIAPSVLAYYQYAVLTLILFTIFLVAILGTYRVSRLEHPPGRTHRWLWAPSVIFAGETLVLASQVSYLSEGSIGLLSATTWPPPGVFDYTSNLGNPIVLFLGTFGVIVSMWLGSKGFIFRFSDAAMLASWVLALAAASGGPWVGIGVEPTRFIWHMVEPFSISSGILLATLVKVLTDSKTSIVAFAGVTLTLVYRSESVRTRTTGVVLSTLVLALVIAPTYGSWLAPVPSEPFFAEDVAVGEWLANHADPNSGIAINSDTDTTATWVQAYSLEPRFFYKANYAITIAAPQFATIYVDIASLFNHPSSGNVTGIIARYGITYVVTHGSETAGFTSNPSIFLQVYRSQPGNVTVFQTI